MDVKVANFSNYFEWV